MAAQTLFIICRKTAFLISIKSNLIFFSYSKPFLIVELKNLEDDDYLFCKLFIQLWIEMLILMTHFYKHIKRITKFFIYINIYCNYKV